MIRELDIEKVSNGYIVTEWTDNEYGKPVIVQQSVFEEHDDERGELDCMVNLLYFVKENFGHGGSDHDRYRLQMEVIDQHETDE